MKRSVFAIPIFKALRCKRTADAIVVNAVVENLPVTGVDIGSPVIAGSAAKQGRVTIAIEVEHPLRELEVLFSLGRAIEEERLQVLILVEARKCEHDQSGQNDSYSNRGGHSAPRFALRFG